MGHTKPNLIERDCSSQSFSLYKHNKGLFKKVNQLPLFPCFNFAFNLILKWSEKFPNFMKLKKKKIITNDKWFI